MRPQELDACWSRVIGEAPPIPYSLRDLCQSRWVRFHALPDARRYAASPADTDEILRRHNALLDHLARRAPRVFLVTTAYSDDRSVAARASQLCALDPSAQPWRVLPMHALADHSEVPNFWHLFASEWTWRPGIFDEILRLVADDEVANVLWLFDGAGCVYHPYDGGADVVLSSTAARDEIRAAYASWLSARRDGL
ncbi:MAG: hypothetical protein R3A48_07840 [Polyangiales bacterium]